MSESINFSTSKFAILSLFIVLISCSVKNDENKSNRLDTTTFAVSNTKTEPATINATLCDTTLWKYVYNPSRLEIVDKCKTVKGVIEESNADDDGDQHMLLKLDVGQESLLTKRNMKKKGGDLVIEAVCINNINKKKVGDACDGYVNHVRLPKVGDHVKVTGSYVIDSHNGWSEIHPISKIEIIK